MAQKVQNLLLNGMGNCACASGLLWKYAASDARMIYTGLENFGHRVIAGAPKVLSGCHIWEEARRSRENCLVHCYKPSAGEDNQKQGNDRAIQNMTVNSERTGKQGPPFRWCSWALKSSVKHKSAVIYFSSDIALNNILRAKKQSNDWLFALLNTQS